MIGGNDFLGSIQGEQPQDIFLPSVVDKRENDVLKASINLNKNTTSRNTHFPRVRYKDVKAGEEGIGRDIYSVETRGGEGNAG